MTSGLIGSNFCMIPVISINHTICYTVFFGLFLLLLSICLWNLKTNKNKVKND